MSSVRMDASHNKLKSTMVVRPQHFPTDTLNKRATFLPFALPDLDESELNEIKDALESGWITTGPKTKQFEKEFADVVGAKHAIAVNSCTAAMHLALEAIGLQRGDEVITTPYTFAATAEVIRYFDAKPVLVDVESKTFNMNPDIIEQAISTKTKAILPVHIAGLRANMNAIFEVARRYNIPVIEDAAHADPRVFKKWREGDGSQSSKVRSQRAEDVPLERDFGGVGAASRGLRSAAVCFSFYATKTITTGEGGMICTDDDAIADRCRIMALHGISRDAWKRYTAEGNWYYEITAPGFKYNMTDVAAAMGIAQLRKAERMLRRRTEIARMYNDAFTSIPNLQPPISNPDHSWHLYMLRLNIKTGDAVPALRVNAFVESLTGRQGRQETEDKRRMSEVRNQRSDSEGTHPSSVPGHPSTGLNIDRAQFIEELKARNIGASVHFIPLHLHPYYREMYGYKPEDFPVAYREYMREISLPIYSKMNDQDVQDVIDAVLDIVEKNKE